VGRCLGVTVKLRPLARLAVVMVLKDWLDMLMTVWCLSNLKVGGCCSPLLLFSQCAPYTACLLLYSQLFCSRWWRQYAPHKHWSTSSRLHGAVFQKPVISYSLPWEPEISDILLLLKQNVKSFVASIGCFCFHLVEETWMYYGIAVCEKTDTASLSLYGWHHACKIFIIFPKYHIGLQWRII
jgi:hypothetical protein